MYGDRTTIGTISITWEVDASVQYRLTAKGGMILGTFASFAQKLVFCTLAMQYMYNV